MAQIFPEPQRQLRDTFETPTPADQGGQPTQPPMQQQRRGGGLIDLSDRQIDNETSQKIQAIGNVVNQSNTLIDKIVKRENKASEELGKRLFDKIAQYQIDTTTIGGAARDARKKGYPVLADQLVGSNPWLWFGLKTAEAGYAGEAALMHANNYANANMGTLQMIEDPSERAKIIQDKIQSYLSENYPSISNQHWAGMVEPALAKGTPLIIKSINNKAAEWKANVAGFTVTTNLTNAKNRWYQVVKDGRSNNKVRFAAKTQLAASILGSRQQALASGMGYFDWQERAAAWVKGLYFDEDKDGVNDLADSGLLDDLREDLDFKIPGHPEGKSFLQLIDPESNQTFDQILNKVGLDSIIMDGKLAEALDRAGRRETVKFEQGFLNLLGQETLGKTGVEKQLVVDQLRKRLLNAERTNGSVVLRVWDRENRVWKDEEFSLPPGLNTTKLINKMEDEGPEMPPWEFQQLQLQVNKRLWDNPEDDLSDVYDKLQPGGDNWTWVNRQQVNALKKLTETDYSPKIKTSFAEVSAAITELNIQAREKAYRNDASYNRKDITSDYKALLDRNKVSAEILFNDFMRAQLLDEETTIEDIKNPDWWKAKNLEFIEAIKSDPDYNDPQRSDLRQSAFDASQVRPLMLYTRGEDGRGDVERSPVTRLRSNKDFLMLNQALKGTGILRDYYKNEPLMSDTTFDKLYSFLYSGTALSGDDINDLRSGYYLAKELSGKGDEFTLVDFLQGQGSKKVFDARSPLDREKSFVPDNEQRLNELKRRLANQVSGTTSTIKWSEDGQGKNGAIDFWMEDNGNGSQNTAFAIPVKMTIKAQGENKGSDGNYSEGIVEETKGLLKKGYIIRIKHARSFGALKVGRTYYAGQHWGLQHTKRTWRPGIDQAVEPGAGPHLHLEIYDSNGRRLPQELVSRIFKEVLSIHLAI